MKRLSIIAVSLLSVVLFSCKKDVAQKVSSCKIEYYNLTKVSPSSDINMFVRKLKKDPNTNLVNGSVLVSFSMGSNSYGSINLTENSRVGAGVSGWYDEVNVFVIKDNNDTLCYGGMNATIFDFDAELNHNYKIIFK